MQLSNVTYAQPDSYSANVSVTVPLLGSLASTFFAASSTSRRSVSPSNAATSYAGGVTAEADDGPVAGAKAASPNTPAATNVAGTADDTTASSAGDLDADAMVQALVGDPDAFPRTSQATGGQVLVDNVQTRVVDISEGGSGGGVDLTALIAGPSAAGGLLLGIAVGLLCYRRRKLRARGGDGLGSRGDCCCCCIPHAPGSSYQRWAKVWIPVWIPICRTVTLLCVTCLCDMWLARKPECTAALYCLRQMAGSRRRCGSKCGFQWVRPGAAAGPVVFCCRQQLLRPPSKMDRL